MLDGTQLREQANHCRNVADNTKDVRAQRELRSLAAELDIEAAKCDAQQAGIGDS